MQKTHALIITLLIVAMLPTGSSSETVSEDYTGTAGVDIMGERFAIACSSGCLGVEPLPRIGGATMESPSRTFHDQAVVSVQDDVWGSEAGLYACFWNPMTDDLICDESSGSACGTVALGAPYFTGDHVTAWALTLIVTHDLDVCGGTAGTITANLF